MYANANSVIKQSKRIIIHHCKKVQRNNGANKPEQLCEKNKHVNSKLDKYRQNNSQPESAIYARV